MNRTHLLVWALSAAFLSWAGSAWAAGDERAEKPNFLVIMADDAGRETLGCYGGTSYKTPHLDALAAGGTTSRSSR